MSDKQWWEPLIDEQGQLDWLCDNEGDYSEKINELWAQFIALQDEVSVAKKPWAGLTDDDKEKCLVVREDRGWHGVLDAVEVKLRDKNGG